MEVSSDGGGIIHIGESVASKDASYTETFESKTEVTMTAEPDAGYEFDYYLINDSKNSNDTVPLYVNCVVNVEARFKSASDHTGSGDDGGSGCFTRTIMR